MVSHPYKVTRRGFFGTLLRSMATAAALAYAPSTLRLPRVIEEPQELWSAWSTTIRASAAGAISAGELVCLDADGMVRAMHPIGDVIGVATSPVVAGRAWVTIQ